MTGRVLTAMRDLIQEDVNRRGLRADPGENLVTACPGDFAAACRSLADHARPVVAVVTGFFIPQAQPPAGETDGPLGALFLARALVPLGIRVVLVTDPFCAPALAAGLEACGLEKSVLLVALPSGEPYTDPLATEPWRACLEELGPPTHLVALERAGPSHTPASVRNQPGATAEAVQEFLREMPPEHYDRCHTMKGRDVTAFLSPAHLLFEIGAGVLPGLTTIGIGDGGNEIGMGKIPWEVIRSNIPDGGLVACRVPTQYLIVCGVSNWGAYGLAAGTLLSRGRNGDGDLWDPKRERELLRLMVGRGPLVDGVTGKPAGTVDGLPFERYAEPLRVLGGLVRERKR